MPQVLWIGGSGRCGTEWTRHVIGSHRQIYEVPVETRYRPQNDTRPLRDWHTAFAHYKALAQRLPWMVEKSPGNVFFARELLRDFPGSRYLHVMRDREATIGTFMRDGMVRHYPVQDCGRPWYREEIEAHLDWVNLVGRNVVADLGPDRAKSVMVENLDPVVIWEWLGLDPEDCDYEALTNAPKNSTAPAD